MKKIIYVMLAVTLIALGACQKKSRIDKLKDLVEEVSKDGKDYTAEQWEETSTKFTEILEEIRSYDDLSTEELQEVAKLQGEYAAAAFKSGGKAIMEQMEKAGAFVKGFMEGLDEGSEKE